jgi:hypothetical protein
VSAAGRRAEEVGQQQESSFFMGTSCSPVKNSSSPVSVPHFLRKVNPAENRVGRRPGFALIRPDRRYNGTSKGGERNDAELISLPVEE